jgi:PhnB protein
MSSTKPAANPKPVLSPCLIVRGGADAISFYTRAFGARELFRLCEPSGKVGHAELTIGDCPFMLADEYPDFGALAPTTIGGSPVSIHLYVEDVDQTFAHAVSVGATALRAVQDEFYGDRTGMLLDPFGHKWHLATRKEEVTPAEMQRRMDAAYA